jgi:hypothetical protein
MRRFLRLATIAVFIGFPSVAASAASASPTLEVALDASGAAQKIYHVKERIAGVTPGPFTFVYPKWIPGYHGPVGPIEGVVSLRVSANGKSLD